MNFQYKKNSFLILCFFAFSMGAIVSAQPNKSVDGTTGTPLGGFGAGGVKYNANDGTFAIMTRPPADAYDFKSVEGSKFQFYSQRGKSVEKVDVMTAQSNNGRPDDDAIWPLHKVNFGSINDVQVNLLGFSPLDNKDYDKMSLPYAFYEMTLANTKASSVTVSIALQWNAENESFKYVAGKGIASYSRAIFVSGTDPDVEITAGNAEDEGFKEKGKCSNEVNERLAKVAVTLDLKGNETRAVKFVIAWYNTTDPEVAYYFNLYEDSKSVAAYGLNQFDKLKSNAETLVNRFRQSNLPAWLKNQTLNTLANLVTNSMYKKDGRVAFAEGQWTCFGTMDQMWHARQIVSQLVPFFAWQELRYWARTQMENGQIHHDFNQMGDASEKEKRSVLVDWDDTEHTDYRDVQKWVDLNCAMIISTYETFQITGNQNEFDFLWPHLKRAGERIFDQVEQYGNEEFPYTFDDSENSYDAGGDPNPFNANLSAVAYKIMMILSKEKGEAGLAKRYQKAYETVVRSFEERYLNDKNFETGKHCESYYAGQWLAFHLNLGEMWDAEKTDFVLSKLDGHYHPFYWGLGNEEGTYDEWTPYILTHYGGLLLNTGRINQWHVMQKDAFDRQYFDRNKVFNHPLNILPVVNDPVWIATSIKSDKQYISMPGIWRNYYDIVGYSRDRRTKELWIKPILPEEADHQMTEALFISPEGYGTVSCTETGTYFQNKEIVVKSDNPIAVSILYLADDFGENVEVSIDGENYPVERIGSGYAKELAIIWNGEIDNKGIVIKAEGDSGMAPPALPESPAIKSNENNEEEMIISAYETIEAESATTTAGVSIENLAIEGAYVTSCNNFDYIQFSNVDFGTAGASDFFVRVASSEGGSTIEIMLDNVAGYVIGNCTVSDTGSFEDWKTISCSVDKVTGVHDLILRFSGATSGNLMNLDKIIFQQLNEKIANPLEK